MKVSARSSECQRCSRDKGAADSSSSRQQERLNTETPEEREVCLQAMTRLRHIVHEAHLPLNKMYSGANNMDPGSVPLELEVIEIF